MINWARVASLREEVGPEDFDEVVNTENKILIESRNVGFNSTPEDPFFFSNVSGDQKVPAEWSLMHEVSRVQISEKGDFTTDKINLWGWKHVICPELFFEIFLKAGETVEWSRSYEVFNLHNLSK